MRIASLLPSCTEIVYALGLGQSLVGVSHECDFPPEAKTKPILTRSKVNPNKSSSQIDKIVEGIVMQGLSVYDININQLKVLNPDIILTQDQCEVCAVSLSDVVKATKGLVGDVEVVSVNPKSLKDIFNDIENIGKVLGKQKEAKELIVSLKNRMDFIKNKIKKSKNLKRPKIICLEWLDPLILSGNWVPEMVELTGGKNILAKPGKKSVKIGWEDFLKLDPDVLVIMPCGFRIEQTLKDMPILIKKKEWPTLRAVREKNVFVVDGNAYFNRPGPRIVESLEILAQTLHPEVFGFGFTEKDWIRLYK